MEENKKFKGVGKIIKMVLIFFIGTIIACALLFGYTQSEDYEKGTIDDDLKKEWDNIADEN